MRETYVNLVDVLKTRLSYHRVGGEKSRTKN